MNRVSSLLLASSVLALALDCSSTPPSQPAPTPQPTSATLFSASIRSVSFEMDYVAGAAPELSVVPGSPAPPFGVLRANLTKLFAGTTKDIQLPASTNEMETITEAVPTDITVGEILALAGRHRNTWSTDTNAAYYVLWLNSYYSADGVRQSGVLAASLGTTGVIAMFKRAIRDNLAEAKLERAAPKVPEQLMLLHEFGHAAGFVNAGITPVSDHQDAEHGRHCNNIDCIMHWTNENFDNLKDFSTRVKAAENVFVFDDACTKDVGLP